MINTDVDFISSESKPLIQSLCVYYVCNRLLFIYSLTLFSFFPVIPFSFDISNALGWIESKYSFACLCFSIQIYSIICDGKLHETVYYSIR